MLCNHPILMYLAGPYSHALASARENRYVAHLQALSTLMGQGAKVFSPIVQGHMAAASGRGGIHDWRREEWLGYDLPILDRCDVLAVLTIPGWRGSWGTQQEIERAQKNNQPIVMLEPSLYVTADTLAILHKAGV